MLIFLDYIILLYYKNSNDDIFFLFSEIEEGPIPVKITSLVWVFLGILSVLVLVLILAGALVRISNICAR